MVLGHCRIYCRGERRDERCGRYCTVREITRGASIAVPRAGLQWPRGIAVGRNVVVNAIELREMAKAIEVVLRRLVKAVRHCTAR